MKAKKEKNKTIDFDDFASKYENYLSDSFGKIDNNVSYYHKAKIKILKKELNIAPKKILDFGCGIGLMLGHLKDNFIDSQLYAYDDSLKSLDYVKSKYPDINCINNLNHNLKFDLIFISNVIHHVKSFEREQLFNKIYNMLNDQGKLFIFEHNPYNPITLKVVANCEFDLNAELIKKNDLIKVCNKSNFIIEKYGYIHFFPSKLKFLFVLESYLKWLFLGAQYFCMFKK